MNAPVTLPDATGYAGEQAATWRTAQAAEARAEQSAWLADMLATARHYATPPAYTHHTIHDLARACVLLADTTTVAVVLVCEGAQSDIVSAWRTREEAEAERDRLQRQDGSLRYVVHETALQGAW